MIVRILYILDTSAAGCLIDVEKSITRSLHMARPSSFNDYSGSTIVQNLKKVCYDAFK